MKRLCLVALLLSSACTHGPSRATPTPTRADDECERELKNARILTTLLDPRTGAKRSERRAPDTPRTDGLMHAPQPRVPKVRVRVTSVKHADYQTDITVHPPGRPAWSVKDANVITQVDDLLLIRTGNPLRVYMARVADGSIVWAQGSFTKDYLWPVSLVDGDLIFEDELGDLRTSPTFVTRVSARTAVPVWRTQLVRRGNLAVAGDLVVSLASAESVHGHGEIQTLDLQTGKLGWRYRLPLPQATDVKVEGDTLLVDSQTIYFGGCE